MEQFSTEIALNYLHHAYVQFAWHCDVVVITISFHKFLTQVLCVRDLQW